MIKNIIFDLCGPIITIDLEVMNKRFKELGVSVDRPYHKLYDAGLTKRYEAGLIGTGEFCDEVRQILDCSLSNEEIYDAWNTLITEFKPEHIALLKELKAKYRTFLLSNSDVVNAKFFCDYMNERAGFDFVGECFDEVFFSCDLKDRKPSPAVFQHILDKHHLKADETMVIDDCRKHCEGAAQTGVRTHFLQRGEDICDLGL